MASLAAFLNKSDNKGYGETYKSDADKNHPCNHHKSADEINAGRIYTSGQGKFCDEVGKRTDKNKCDTDTGDSFRGTHCRSL